MANKPAAPEKPAEERAVAPVAQAAEAGPLGPAVPAAQPEAARKVILLTGGGTAGHVALNLALIPRLLAQGWEVHYVGREEGIERDLLADYPMVPYHSIQSGKFRRDKSWASFKQNVKDVGHVLSGISMSKKILKAVRPNIVFSKGGFVAVPVVRAAHSLHIPIIAHESDLTPGLANRLSAPKAERVLVTFKASLNYVDKDKGLYVGPVIREQIRGGDRARGLQTFGFSGDKPILFVMGGSLGSHKLNQGVRSALDPLLATFDILHSTGQGDLDPSIHRSGYVQREFIKEDLADALAMADMVISRAGSNAIFEFLSYRIPMLLVPLAAASRGDQIQNAQVFQEAGYAHVFEEKDLPQPGALAQAALATWQDRAALRQAQETFVFPDSLGLILEQIDQISGCGQQ